VLQIKKNEYTNIKWSFCNVYPCIRANKSLFLQNKYTKDGCEGKKPLHRRKTIFCVFKTGLGSCWLRLPCHHLILFLWYPLTNHKLQPTAAAAVSAAVAAADYILRPHYNRCQEDNIVVAVVLARSVLVVVVNCSPASTMMGPHPSFSWRDSN
jgi:hypothetical protein